MNEINHSLFPLQTQPARNLNALMILYIKKIICQKSIPLVFVLLYYIVKDVNLHQNLNTVLSKLLRCLSKCHYRKITFNPLSSNVPSKFLCSMEENRSQKVNLENIILKTSNLQIGLSL